MPNRDPILRGSQRQAAGPNVSQKPGTVPSDYKWDAESGQWVFDGAARPGMVYAPSGEYTRSGKSGWVPVSDFRNTNGLFRGWTGKQILTLAGVGGAAAAGPIAGALGGGGGAAGAAAAAAPEAGGTLASTSLAGAATLPVAGAGNMVGGTLAGTSAASGAASVGSRILGAFKKGGTVDNILGTLGRVAPILSSAAGARANARDNENTALRDRDRLNQSAGIARNNANLSAADLDLRRRQYSLDAPGTRMSSSVRGSIIANAHNVGIGTGDPITLTSGKVISPIRYTGIGPDDLINSNTRALGQKVTEDELQAQMAGDKFDPLPPANIPGASEPDKGGVMDDVLGGAALGTSIAGGLSPTLQEIIRKASRRRTTDDSTDGL